MIHYLIMILRDIKKISRDIRRKLELVGMLLSAVKEKIEDASGSWHSIIKAVSNLSGYFKGRKEKRAGKKKERKKRVKKKRGQGPHLPQAWPGPSSSGCRNTKTTF